MCSPGVSSGGPLLMCSLTLCCYTYSGGGAACMDQMRVSVDLCDRYTMTFVHSGFVDDPLLVDLCLLGSGTDTRWHDLLFTGKEDEKTLETLSATI